MELVTPGLGLVFWQTITFLVVLFVLGKYAWKPILNSLKDREDSIAKALMQAEEAKNQMAQIQSSNEKLLDEARLERDKMLKESRKVADDIVAEAKDKAQSEADKLVENARKAIETEKQAAITAVKAQVSTLSVEIAEKLLKKQLENPEQQRKLVEDLVSDMKLN